MNQHCDSTCNWCAREFWRWLREYQKKRAARPAKNGKPAYLDFLEHAATSIKPESE